MFSDVTESELLKAPEKVRTYFRNLPIGNVERVIVNAYLSLEIRSPREILEYED